MGIHHPLTPSFNIVRWGFELEDSKHIKLIIKHYLRFFPDKVLFTPGPLTCTLSVKQEMLRDLGSRDTEFIEIVKNVRNELLEIAGK